MKIKIENMEFDCVEGETILEVARRNNIQIPTICYLSGCSPTLACKMCMVSVGGKRVYSCNAKVKDGMEVLIATDDILKDRKEIMTTYCVNHPLECGVCDKSGECELQDFVLHTGVDTQLFGLQESDKKSYSFAQSFYDPALCIMCERCATTCKDNIGENNLKAGKANLFAPDAYKDSMGKDPHSVWAKRQKGLIEFIGKNECKDCGECISVCPVGAMTYKDFTYTSNAWELEKISSTCTHCAGGCQLIYNVKHLDVVGDLKKVYRVQNDYLYNPICGVGRFAFDCVSVGSRNIQSALDAFNKCDCIFLGSEASNEEAFIAQKIAQHLNVEIYNYEAKAYRVFQDAFLSASSFFGKKEIFAKMSDFKSSDSFVCLNTYPKYDAPSIRYKINNNMKIQKSSQLLIFGVFSDSLIQSLGKNVTQIVMDSENISLIGILGLVFANDLIDDFEECFPNALQSLMKKDEYLDNTQTYKANSTFTKEDIKDQDSDTTNTDESKESLDNLTPYSIEIILQKMNIKSLDSLKIKKGGILMISLQVLEEFMSSDLIGDYGLEFYNHDSKEPSLTNAVAMAIMENLTQPIVSDLIDREVKLHILAYLISFICSKLDLKLLYIPKGPNVIGIANLCNLSWNNPLDCESSSYSVGIRHSADFILDSNLSAIKQDFPLPTLAQNEGSITSMDYRVLPLVPSIPYLDSNLQDAFDLSDIAKALSVFSESILGKIEFMGDFTEFLESTSAKIKYKNIPTYMLKSSFEKDGRDCRGYYLSKDLDSIEYDKDFIARLIKFSLKLNENPFKMNAIMLETQNQFSLTTLSSNNLQTKSGIYTSRENMRNLDLTDGCEVSLNNGISKITAQIFCDNDLNENIFLVSPLIFGVKSLFQNGFYAQVEIEKINVESSVV